VSCPRCGRVAAESDRFCGSCGVELAATCRQCGRQLGTDEAFCTGCGTPRAVGPVPQAATEDRRRVSVLFIDLIDSTPYAERTDPELVRRLQTAFYAAARRVVRQYGGVVEKYIGDAVMALFGAPVATETDALRCVRAGLELQRVLSTFDVSAPEADEMRFRVGIATGEALVDVAAARDGGQAILAGDVVNTAARLQEVAPAGGVLVCGQTHALTSDTIRYADQKAVTLRGHAEPTEVWLALAPAQRHAAERDTLPLIEREHELSLLVNALHRTVRDRTPLLVTVFGQAGIGKSRLVRELYRHAHRLLDQPVTWSVGHCRPFGEDVTYAGLADIVKATAGILDTDSGDTARARLLHATRELATGHDADRLAAALGPLVGLPGGELPAKEAESAWRRFLVAVAARRPTVLVFEDLHWADERMLRFIELLAAGARDVPLLVLTTARPELVDRDPSWAGTIAGSLTVTLPPLRSSGVATLYAQLFGQAAFTSDLLTPLVELANGNPLYAQEYVRMLIERGSLPGSGQPWRGDGEAALPTPDSVHAVIANRVDLLDPADRAVLQSAAVVGMRFWPGAVAAALGRPVDSVERSLRRLEQREFIAEQPESSVAGDSEFRFRHVLVRDVCYQRLPRTQRVARHQHAADWLEALSSKRDTDLAEVLAHHRWSTVAIARTLGTPTARHIEAARRALYHAARRAYALHALDVATRHIDRALSLFPAANAESSDPAVIAQRLRLELLANEIAFYSDQAGFHADGGTDQLTDLATRLAAVGADGAAARAYTLLGQAAWLRVDRTTALAHLNRAVALFDPLPDSPEKVDAYAELGRLHMLNYEREPAVAAATRAAEIAERLDLAEARADARITIGTARYDAGDPTALDLLEEVAEQCREGRLLALRRATQNLANAWLEEGDWRRSVELVAKANSAIPGGHNLAPGYSEEAVRAYATGDLDAFVAAADAYADVPGSRWDVRIRGLRSFLRLLRSEPAAASDDVVDALALARGGGFHRLLWMALAMAALCRSLQGRQLEAAELLDELTCSWRKVPVMASGAWACSAAHAAALTGPGPAEDLKAALLASPRRTRWAQAALHTVTGATALAEGRPADATGEHLAAAAIFDEIPAVTDRMVSLALAADALAVGGDEGRATTVRAEVQAFAQRASAPGLLRLAHSRDQRGR
jgi:predicted ATPase/class 3 adenylate cyclase